MIRHYYHVYADGRWIEPVVDHLLAIATIDVPMHLTVGIVGNSTNRAKVRQVLQGFSVKVDGWIEENVGWEQMTLSRLRKDLSDFEFPVLYAHTKGAYDCNERNTLWRQSMTQRVIIDWKLCLRLLTEYDAVGCHWLTPQQFPVAVKSPYFGGNFWWANARYLRKLPPLAYISRWNAESWIGFGNPKIYDLLPGWPNLGTFCKATSQSTVSR